MKAAFKRGDTIIRRSVAFAIMVVVLYFAIMLTFGYIILGAVWLFNHHRLMFWGCVIIILYAPLATLLGVAVGKVIDRGQWHYK